MTIRDCAFVIVTDFRAWCAFLTFSPELSLFVLPITAPAAPIRNYAGGVAPAAPVQNGGVEPPLAGVG